MEALRAKTCGEPHALTCSATALLRDKVSSDARDSSKPPAKKVRRTQKLVDPSDLTSSDDEQEQAAAQGHDPAMSDDDEGGSQASEELETASGPVAATKQTKGNGAYLYRTFRNGLSSELVTQLLGKLPSTCLVLGMTSRSLYYSCGGVVAGVMRFNEEQWGIKRPCQLVMCWPIPIPPRSCSTSRT